MAVAFREAVLEEGVDWGGRSGCRGGGGGGGAGREGHARRREEDGAVHFLLGAHEVSARLSQRGTRLRGKTDPLCALLDEL